MNKILTRDLSKKGVIIKASMIIEKLYSTTKRNIGKKCVC